MDQFERIKLQIKDENLDKIKNTSVTIVGVGGVGSYAIESLVRIGIGTITIIDNDIVDITNLNRQLMTLNSNVGENKVDVWEKRIKDINPNCNVNKIREFITKDNINLIGSPDYIIDACDTLETKKELIRYATKNNIKIICSMGMGNKLDPSKIEIIDIRKTSYDPLAKAIRKMVKDEKIYKKIPVVCSTEKAIKTGSTTISSNSFIPAISGLLCTSYIINDIIDKGVIYENK